MDSHANRLLCIDLQVDSTIGLEPDAKAIFGARQLLTMGRRLGWTIAHARRRSIMTASNDHGDQRVGAMRPLMSERVFLRPGRAIADSPGALKLLESWRDETVFVAAFDHVALLSCLLACYEHGPRLVLVEDVLSVRALSGKTSIDAFRTAAWHLAAGTTTISRIISETDRRFRIESPAFSSVVGATH
jgi:hypothetical protein